MQREIDRKSKYEENRPGGVGSLLASLKKNNKWWENNYCWEIDRTSNNHEDIQAMFIYIGITSKISRPTPACIYYYYCTHRPLSSMHIVY